MIRVQPTAALRVDFARWAVAQTPKVRTVSPSDFAVPAYLFTHMPEPLLLGALVDGRQYVPVEDEPAEPEEGTTASDDSAPAELLGVATPEGLTALVHETPGEPLPPLPDSAYGSDAVPLPEPERQLAATSPAAVEAAMTAAEVAVELAAANAETRDRSDSSPEVGPPYACASCPRTFTTQRGRDTHRRHVHPEA
ncbi:hypothetical protein OG235_37120 [Streptomyces sp. NBC_00024]|uniref:hypothetical protein n=1 Tax=Streptomyces sp. NBC_00024 TaxID=2903612 RepID=UPI00324B972E